MPNSGQDFFSANNLPHLPAKHFEYFCLFRSKRLAFFAIEKQVLGGNKSIVTYRINVFFLRFGHQDGLLHLEYGLDMSIKFFGQEGFLDVEVCAGLIAVNHVACCSQSRDKNNRHARMMLPDMAYHRHAIHHGHLNVRHNHIEFPRSQFLQTFFAVRGCFYLVTANHLFQAALQNETEILIIFH